MASTAFPTRALTAAVFTLLAWAATPFTTQAQLPDYLPTEGLVGWWPFNGNAHDESGNGNDGVVNGSILSTPDRGGSLNSAYDWSNSNSGLSSSSYISIPNLSPQFTSGAISISIWVMKYPNPLFQDPRIFSIGEYGLVFNGYSSSIKVFIGLGLDSFTDPLEEDNWAHIVYTSQGASGESYFFLNGILIHQRDTEPSLFICDPNLPWEFGRKSISGFIGFGGKLDDIAIYNRALTPEEITALYTGIPYVAPCTDPTACNFEQEGECVFAAPNLDCAGSCLNDCNNNGVCDEVEVYGCTYAFACNYNPEATTDDGTCTVALANYDCDGNCLLDLNNNGLCDLEEAAGCTNIDAINYNADATLDDGSCMVTCKGDFDNDGQITINDLLGFLAAFGNQCQGAGCMDPAGCNYDPNATFDLGYCEYPAEFFNCDGTPINDADGDGIPDELEVAGCTNPEAGNYNPDATDDNGSCTFGLTGATHSCGAENVHNPDLVYGSVTDIDGNTYRTIVIGEQEWMAENLNVEHYANGDPIPNVIDSQYWGNSAIGQWCYYNNVQQFECPRGKLYNWYVTIDVRNACPTGWHVPTDMEWAVLTDFLGGLDVAGGKLKSVGTQYWQSVNIGATNESGFSAIPGGRRFWNGTFSSVGSLGEFWSSTESDIGKAWMRLLGSTQGYAFKDDQGKDEGFSIRCLKD